MDYELSSEEIKSIFNGLELSHEEWKYLAEKFKRIELKKGEHLLRGGNIVEHTYYIYSGCMRNYFLDKSGKEHTFQFAVRDWWISDFHALYHQSNASMNIEAIQDTVVFALPVTSFEEMCVKIRSVEVFHRRKLQGAFASFQRRIIENMSMTAKERYISFIERYPDIEKNVKNYHIASFLGITSESLSRIRKSLS